MNINVERGSGIALWRQIEETLAAEIARKILRERLPNETELATRFGVNRHTVRRAVQALEARGLVRIEQGRGTFVQEEFIDYKLGKRSRFSHSLEKQQLAGTSQVQRSREVVPRDEVCAMLGVANGTPALQVDALDVVDGRVIGVCTQYFPLPRFRGFDVTYKHHGSVARALGDVGITEYSRKLSRVSTRLPEADCAQQLGQPKTQPILFVESVYIDGTGQPIEYGITRFAGDAVQLLFEPEAV
ncbi:phosphonate metabolism transcriptional regulator PhnF [Silvimonas amylolytica]|uniref:Phosphonate metabolism transcriptional regulator PhnF n=1 Tax=Silvimonas amylolytica TaxID=449663 RepID=A0ABQ2PHX1_9NEIS|nr:phosphonate metabolism transcriptional regulator PhnF [Silvimonas amylolytica]GGP24903.1 phosphonate metabolism transcriptional regulator PhnF [Silvimonas amylolytica]